MKIINVNIQPSVMTAYQPGAIVSDCWGCEQTNYDFYCIVARSGDYVTLLPMLKEYGKEEGFMCNRVKPLAIDWTAKPIRKKVKSFDGEEKGFSLRPYAGGGWCSLWNGEPKMATYYA